MSTPLVTMRGSPCHNSTVDTGIYLNIRELAEQMAVAAVFDGFIQWDDRKQNGPRRNNWT